ncbi:MAG: carboxypeptidase-like regulatory domain-containing protein [Bacteroidales bacterium]|nr:carboxypeptidase-like regulatory domain-containing protein [Bacteroidales bacterium]
MKKLISTVLIVLFAFQLTNASNDKDSNENNSENGVPVTGITINGKVLDKETNESLAGVLIELEGTNEKVYTDFDGKFEFKNVQPNIYDISVTYIAYEKSKLKVVDAKNKVNTLKVELKKQ